MTVLIILKGEPAMTGQLASWICTMRAADEQRYRRPRSLLHRLRDALKPDRPHWSSGGGDQWNNMPGFAFKYEETQ